MKSYIMLTQTMARNEKKIFSCERNGWKDERMKDI